MTVRLSPARGARLDRLVAVMMLGLAVAAPGQALAGIHDETGWITQMLDGGDLKAPKRKAPSARRSKVGATSNDQPAAQTQADKPARRGKGGRQVASLGREPVEDLVARQPSLTGRVVWQAPVGCLAGQLASLVADVAANSGPVRVGSTCRSHRHNARVGGARRSYHLTGSAVDFRVFGNVRAVFAYLRSHGLVGGLKHYGGGLFHVDTGARRPM